MSRRRSVCVVVDAYSTATALPRVFAGYGFPTLHVQSSVDVPDVLLGSFREHDFIGRATYRGSLDDLVGELGLGQYQVRCVVAGSESGVLLADRLAQWLGVPGNGTAHSEARRNKFLMAETVRAVGLRTIPQLKSSDVEEVIRWVQAHGFAAIVLKPLASSGTNGLHICSGSAEVRQAFANLHGASDIFGQAISEVLVQPLIGGEEYCVNVVSHGGQHYVADVWHTQKRLSGHSKLYDLESLVAPTEGVYGQLTAYALKVLDALGIQYGPSHTELILGTAGDPLLIEVGARFMGSAAQSLVTDALGTNAVLLTAEAILTPEDFLARLGRARPAVRKLPFMVQMLSRRAGVLRGYALDRLAALDTFHGVDCYLRPGDAVRPTVDSYSSPGLIFLSGASREKLMADYRAIRVMEEAGILHEIEG